MAVSNNIVCKIGPSVLNSDLSELYIESERLLSSGADYLHLDVMDGHFVPNITFGHPVVSCLRRKIPDVFFDLHMMVADPDKWIEPMADAGASQYTFHLEATNDPLRTIRKVREAGMKVGIGIKPATPVQDLVPFLELIDMALIMTVEPGFGGQSFMSDMMPKVNFLRSRYRELDIEVDGGVGPNTIDQCAEPCISQLKLHHGPVKYLIFIPQAGANMIVSGTAVTQSTNPRQVISALRTAVEESLQKARLER